MIGVFIDHDVITVPIPAIAIDNIVIGNGKEEAAEPEATRPAAFKPEDMARPKAAGEVSMRPWTIYMEVLIMAARVMSDPAVVRMNMRRFRMAWMVGETASLLNVTVFLNVAMLLDAAVLLGRMRLRTHRRRTMRGNVLSARAALMMLFLRKCIDREDQECSENTRKFLHNSPPASNWGYKV